MAKRTPKKKAARPGKRPARRKAVPAKRRAPDVPLPRTVDLVHAPRTAVAADITNMTPTQAAALRELFWQNVVREILTSLSMISAQRMATGNPDVDSHADIVPDVDVELDENEEAEAEDEGAEVGGMEVGGHIAPPQGGPGQPELFDGRMALLMKNGERIPIGDVFPVFACGINTELERALSIALECSVFQIRTPRGQVYTIPLHEVRSFHALSPELMRRLEQTSRRGRAGGVPEQVPFGFAAFTALSNGRTPLVPEAAPDYPTE